LHGLPFRVVAGEGGLGGIHAVLGIACGWRFDFSDGLLPDRIGSVRFGVVVASMCLVGEVCLCAALYKLFVEERPSESKVSLSDGLSLFPFV